MQKLWKTLFIIGCALNLDTYSACDKINLDEILDEIDETTTTRMNADTTLVRNPSIDSAGIQPKASVASFDTSTIPWWWSVKKNFFVRIFSLIQRFQQSSNHTYPPPTATEQLEIVSWKDLNVGVPIANLYTTQRIPAAENSWFTSIAAKTFTFLHNHLPLVVPGLPEVPEDPAEYLKVCFPQEYSSFLPTPVIPREISEHLDDIVGGYALSGPYAGYIRRLRGKLPKELNTLRKSKELYEIDLQDYEQYPVKEGLETLGGRVILTYNYEKKCMETRAICRQGHWYTKESRKTTTSDWQHLQKIILATLASDTAMVRHLFAGHLFIGGPFAAVSNMLPAEHPLRILMYLHQFRTLSANANRIPSVFNSKNAFFSSIFSYELDTLLKITSDKISTFDISSLDVPQVFERDGMEKTPFPYPYAKNTKRLWNIIEKYASNYINVYYKSDKQIQEDDEIQKLYDVLNRCVPNNQIEQYMQCRTRKEKLSRLMTLYIYTVSVLHQLSGAVVTNFQFWQNYIPAQVRIDRKRPSIGIAQEIVNLELAVYPSYSFNLVDLSPDFALDTSGKIVMNEFVKDLLDYQKELEEKAKLKTGGKIPVSIAQPKDIQTSVNA